MIWIDFGILCIGQEQPSVPADMQALRFECFRRTENAEPLYNESYHFHTADRLPGFWYQIWLPDPVCYEESFFDISSRGIPCVEVVPKWAEQVEKLLRFYLSQSPDRQIAVLLRIQDRSQDIVHPACSPEDFLRDLTAGTVRWNELYLVHA